MTAYKGTIIILDYMKAAQVLRNVASLQAQVTDFKFKIIVVDNSCDRGNAELLAPLAGQPNVVLYINKKNLGYTKAHNQVKAEIEGEYVLIVNPDIEWCDPRALETMIAYLEEHQDIGVLGPRQINKDGEVALTIRAFPKLYLQVARRTFLRKLPFIKNKVEYDEMRHLDLSQTQNVDWLQSSCVVLRKRLWREINGLNEEYFLFMSDVEICYEAWKRGYRVVYLATVSVEADGKRVSAGGFKQFFKNWVLRQHVKDSLKYRFKHFLAPNPRIKFKTNKADYNKNY